MATIVTSEHFVAAAAVTGCLLLMGGYFLMKRREREASKPWAFLPGWRPIVGHAHLALPVKEMVTKWEQWADEYAPDDIGCYEMELMGRRFLIVSSEERAMELLQHRPHIMIRPHQTRASARSTGNYGIFQAEGDEWKQDHKLVVPALNKANVKDYVSIFKVMAHRLVDLWMKADDGKCVTVTIGSDLSNVASDSIAKASMGVEMDFLNKGSDDVVAFRKVMASFIERALSPICYWNIPFIGQYLDGYGGSIRRTTKMIDNIVKKYEDIGGDETKRTFLQKVYSLMQKGESISRQRLVGNVLGLFMAGTDTTSKALVTAFYLLAQDEGLQATLREEADAVDLESMSLQDFFQKIPRIKSFLHEVHRWYGAPVIGLYATQDVPFCGTTLPKGADIVILGRSITWKSSDLPKGPNNAPPDKFDAARYLVTEEDGSLSSIFPNTRLGGFLGFGHGVRACPGRTYSEALSYAVLIAVFQAFTWTLAPEHPNARFIFDIVMTPGYDVQLVLTKRDKVTVD
ncbi:hypothetical protein MPSEU_000089100 [Mayamaea pseudoterrestris]|nr:hypothetical protein MPSEU_000089100 [Mayamaea pseudoterrestris]